MVDFLCYNDAIMDLASSDLIGHRQALELIRRIMASGRLGSALLLVGAEGIGKREIADFIVG